MAMADRRVAVVPAEALSGTAAARRCLEEVAAEWVLQLQAQGAAWKAQPNV